MIASTRRTQGALRPFLALFGIAFFLLLARDTPPIVAAQSLASRALIPIERVASDAGAAVSGFFGSIAELEALRGDNERLRTQVETLTLENVRLREQAAAAQQVANLNGIAAGLPYKTIVAQVIARDPAGFVRTLTIDAGSDVPAEATFEHVTARVLVRFADASARERVIARHDAIARGVVGRTGFEV